MIKGYVRAIALHTLSPLDVADTSHVILFPAVLTLQHARVYIGTIDCSSIASNIEASVDDLLGVRPILYIPDVKPDDSHVWLEQNLDDSRFGYKNNLIKNVVLENFLNVFKWNAYIGFIIQVGNYYNFQVGFRLWKARRSYLIFIILKQTLYNFLDFL